MGSRGLSELVTAIVTVRGGLAEVVDGADDAVIVNFDVTELVDPEAVREEIAGLEESRRDLLTAGAPQWLLEEVDSCVAELRERLEPGASRSPRT